MNTLTLQEQAPDLAIEISGNIITSNFGEFRGTLLKFINNAHVELESDDDFVAAQDHIKVLKKAESALISAKARALDEASEIQSLFVAIDSLTGDSRTARLDLERQIKARKEEMRTEIIEEAAGLIDAANMAPYRLRIVQACKGKKTFSTLRKAALAMGQELAGELAENRETIKWFEESNGRALTADVANLEQMQGDQLNLELKLRLERFEAEEEKKELLKKTAEANARAEKAEKKETLADKQSFTPVQKEEPAPAETKNPETPDPRSETGNQAAELRGFTDTLREAFKAVKIARSQLRDSRNIKIAQEFADRLLVAWLKLIEEENQH